MRVLRIILHAAKKEPSGLARCIALSGLGIYLIQEFHRRSKHAYIKEAFNTLLLALKVIFLTSPILRNKNLHDADKELEVQGILLS